MASGDTLHALFPEDASPPISNYARRDERGATDPFPVLDFAVGESAVFPMVLPRHYAGGGVTFRLICAATSATSGNFKLATAVERHQVGTDDLDASSFATAVTPADTAVPGTSGETVAIENAHADGSPIDNAVAGELVRVKVTRSAASSSEASGDIELVGIEVREGT
jgi:hypothetical protein